MMIRSIFLLIILSLGIKSLKAASVEIIFYSEKVKVEYDNSICIKYKMKPNDENIQEFYDLMEKKKFNILQENLVSIKNILLLNDWLYYVLIKKTVNEIFKKESDNFRTVFCWYILNKSGYLATIISRTPYEISVNSNDKVFGTGIFFYENKRYVNLTQIKNSSTSTKEINLLKFFPNKTGKLFNFSISIPILKNDSVISKKVEIVIKERKEVFEYKLSGNIIEMMKDYPQLKAEEYFKIPPSSVLYNSLFVQLKEKFKDIDSTETVRYLLSFVRLSSLTIDDQKTFGYSKPMIVEEALFYEYGDCEDKSVLFYYLIKELVKIPIIVLRYPKHANVAVKLDKVYGKGLDYKGIKYSVCEPSEMGDVSNIGYSTEFDHYKPKVIVEYNPMKQ